MKTCSAENFSLTSLQDIEKRGSDLMENTSASAELELLAKLAEGQRKALRSARLTSLICLVIALTILFLAMLILPRVASAMDQLEGTLTKMEDAMDTLDSLGSSISAVEGAMEHLDSFIENADALSGAASRLVEIDIDSLNDGIKQISQISQIDFDKLNKAISDLSEVIEPMAKFSGLFN